MASVSIWITILSLLVAQYMVQSVQQESASSLSQGIGELVEATLSPHLSLSLTPTPKEIRQVTTQIREAIQGLYQRLEWAIQFFEQHTSAYAIEAVPHLECLGDSFADDFGVRCKKTANRIVNFVMGNLAKLPAAQKALAITIAATQVAPHMIIPVIAKFQETLAALLKEAHQNGDLLGIRRSLEELLARIQIWEGTRSNMPKKKKPAREEASGDVSLLSDLALLSF